MEKYSRLEILKNKEKENSNGIKILFTGLDNAGKSSIILSLLREFSKIGIIRPTKGAQRRVYEFLGMNISEWDLGGQKKYRDSYLKDYDLFFGRTDIMIYVIDIQNPDRISESLTYLNDIIENFKKLKIEPGIYVFFHKIDPEIYNKAQKEIESIISKIKNQMEKKINYRKINFNSTSIFDLSSILNAMSEILITKFPKSRLINDTIDEFTRKFNVEGLEIVDDNSFIIGSYYNDDFIKNLLNSTVPYFLKLNDAFEDVKSEQCQPEDKMMIHRFGKVFLFKKFTLQKEAPFYYLLICKEEGSELNEQDYKALINLLKKILSKE